LRIIDDIAAMQQWADDARARGRYIGFVPTMGYLHDGHLSLVHLARERTDTVVASIFVNPTQFGPAEDLAAYPRDIEGDCARLRAAGTDVLFLPTAETMYPRGYQTSVAVAGVTRGLCGAARPVHFGGVATVVTKLFHIVKPHVAVFGCKDFQQLVTIRRLVTDLSFDIEIVGGPIVREADGVAMSSRNAYLSPAERKAAVCLSQALAAARTLHESGVVFAADLLAAVRARIAAEPLATLDYASLVDAETLEDVAEVTGPTLLAVAAGFGKARLIDNTVLDEGAAAGSRSAGRLD
jgi:pantoate--beta-alanine ligase